MTRIGIVSVVVAAIGVGALSFPPALAQTPTSLLPGQGIPRCDIPKNFGRLVTILPGNNTGLTGQTTNRDGGMNALAAQAVFEAPDGTIRWVAIVAPANTKATQQPALRVMPRNFPVLPIYECAVGHVWQRP